MDIIQRDAYITSTNNVIYLKTWETEKVHQYTCSSAPNCVETEYLTTNIDPLYISNLKHTYRTTDDGAFWGLNLQISDGTNKNHIYFPYEFWDNLELLGLAEQVSDTWVSLVLQWVNGLKIFSLKPITNANNWIVYDIWETPLALHNDWFFSSPELFYMRWTDLYTTDTEDGSIFVSNNIWGNTSTGTPKSTWSWFLNVVWDGDGDGEIWIWEAITWFWNTIVWIFSAIWDFFTSLYELITKLNDIFTTEEKSFSFIPSASAADSDYLTSMFPDREVWGYNDTVLWKMEKFFYAAIVMIVFIIGIAWFISINKE